MASAAASRSNIVASGKRLNATSHIFVDKADFRRILLAEGTAPSDVSAAVLQAPLRLVAGQLGALLENSTGRIHLQRSQPVPLEDDCHAKSEARNLEADVITRILPPLDRPTVHAAWDRQDILWAAQVESKLTMRYDFHLDKKLHCRHVFYATVSVVESVTMSARVDLLLNLTTGHVELAGTTPYLVYDLSPQVAVRFTSLFPATIDIPHSNCTYATIDVCSLYKDTLSRGDYFEELMKAAAPMAVWERAMGEAAKSLNVSEVAFQVEPLPPPQPRKGSGQGLHGPAALAAAAAALLLGLLGAACWLRRRSRTRATSRRGLAAPLGASSIEAPGRPGGGAAGAEEWS